jgi:ubiquinone/menaquinone biosynthesis C-methylase UbiE
VSRPVGRIGTDRAGGFGPEAYEKWRASSLGDITEELERRLIFGLAGELGGRTILDVGCGDGTLVAAFRNCGAASVVGCDIDPQMVARGNDRARCDQVQFTVASAERLPFPDDSFDIATIITVLAFLPEPETALLEIARVLKRGGRLVIGDLAKWSLWAASRRIRVWRGEKMWQSAHFWTGGELRELVIAAGLRFEEATGAVYYPQVGFLARLMARADRLLSRVTIFGAAFIAARATKPVNSAVR